MVNNSENNKGKNRFNMILTQRNSPDRHLSTTDKIKSVSLTILMVCPKQKIPTK